MKIDLHCHVQGDVVLECINLYEDLDREEMVCRIMFNTAFIRSNILMLNRDHVDMLWNAKDQFPKDFRFEVSVYAKWRTRLFLQYMDFYMQLLLMVGYLFRYGRSYFTCHNRACYSSRETRTWG